LKSFLIGKRGNEKGIDVELSVGETTGVRWPPRTTPTGAAVATAGSAVLSCRAIFAKHRGAVEGPASKQSPGTIRVREKFLSKKHGQTQGRVGPTRLVKGIPDGGCDSCSDWLLKNIDKTKGCRAKIGGIARHQFEILLDDCIRALLEHALPRREKDATTKQWAARVLAKVHGSLEAHQWKLARENPAYKEWKTKIGKTRADVLIPQSEISQMVQEELRTAEIYHSQLWYLRESIERQPDLHLGTVNKKAVFEHIRDQFVLPRFAGVCRTKLKGEALERRYGALWTKQGLAAIGKAARKATTSLFYPDEILQSVSCTCKTWPRDRGFTAIRRGVCGQVVGLALATNFGRSKSAAAGTRSE
jgi:hypothetical protein